MITFSGNLKRNLKRYLNLVLLRYIFILLKFILFYNSL